MRICLLDVDKGAAAAFGGNEAFEVVAIRSTGDDHQLSLAEIDPDVVLLGHDQGTITKWTAALIESIGRETEAAVVVRSRSGTFACVSRALTAGAQGFVLRTEPVETLHGAIRAVAGGEIWVSPSLRPMVLRDLAQFVRTGAVADGGVES